MDFKKKRRKDEIYRSLINPRLPRKNTYNNLIIHFHCSLYLQIHVHFVEPYGNVTIVVAVMSIYRIWSTYCLGLKKSSVRCKLLVFLTVFLLTLLKRIQQKPSKSIFLSQFIAKVIALTYEKEESNWETICKFKKVIGVKIVSSCIRPKTGKISWLKLQEQGRPFH